MSKFLFLTKKIMAGESVLRAYTDYHLQSYELRGRVVDIGGGGGKDYLGSLKNPDNVQVENIDVKAGTQVDFETDRLPIEDGTFDTVLFLNVMEHIFNYQHIANEVVRVTKPGGTVIGYVPFLIWYHPDHRDFFRYTHEALKKIIGKTEAKSFEIVPNHCGPFIAAAQMMVLSIPRILRPLVFIPAYGLDKIFFLLKNGEVSKRFVLGYLFIIEK